MMPVDLEAPLIRHAPEVLRCAVADVRQGDQVAFVSAGQGGHVAGEVTGRRASKDGSGVALMVDDHVHHVSPGHMVIVIRFRTEDGT